MDVMRKHTSRPNLQQGALSDTEGDEMLQLEFLASLRLVGCAYMKKHSAVFQGLTPASSLGSCLSTKMHINWLDRLWKYICISYITARFIDPRGEGL